MNFVTKTTEFSEVVRHWLVRNKNTIGFSRVKNKD